MSPLRTRFTDLVGIQHPVVQDGMGPYKTSALAAAVSEAGGLGTVSIPGMTRDPVEAAAILRSHIDETASLTSRPFAVNVPVGRDGSGQVLPMTAAYLGAVFDARASDSALAAQLRVLTTSAGFPGDFRSAIADSGLIHMHKVGSVRHAVKVQEAGVDVIIASGYEMGGHTHASPVHTFVVVPSITAAVDVPVLLSGGAHDGRTLAAALALGASGIAMGTRFIATHENEWHPAYRERVVAAQEGDDVVFPAVYGPARGLHTRAVDRLRQIIANHEMDEDQLTRWKDQALTRAQEAGDVDDGLMPAGQVASAINSLVSVAEFVPAICADAASVLADLSRSVIAAAPTAAS